MGYQIYIIFSKNKNIYYIYIYIFLLLKFSYPYVVYIHYEFSSDLTLFRNIPKRLYSEFHSTSCSSFSRRDSLEKSKTYFSTYNKLYFNLSKIGLWLLLVTYYLLLIIYFYYLLKYYWWLQENNLSVQLFD